MKKFICFFPVLFFFLQIFYVSAQLPPLGDKEVIEEKLDRVRDQAHVYPTQENLLLQLKAASERLGYVDGILRSGDYLMGYYLASGQYREAIEIGTQLKKITKNKNYTYDMSGIYRRNGLALGYLGLDQAGLNDFKTAITYANKIHNIDNRLFQLSLCYQNIGLYYVNKRFENKKRRDSILYYYKKSLDAANQINDNSQTIAIDLKYEQIAFTEMRLGINYLEQTDVDGNLELAEKYLLSALKIYENEKYRIIPENKITMLNQVSWLYMEKKECQKSIDFARRALALEKQFNSPYDRVESFEFLATCYLELGQNENSKSYMEKYSLLKDSLNYVDKNNADATMKKMVSAVDNTYKERRRESFIIIGIVVFIITITILFLWKRKNVIIHQKYEALIAKINAEKDYENAVTALQYTSEDLEIRNTINITDETTKSLFQKLEKFEKSQKYLRHDITQSWLANHLNTNTKYLREIIKIRSSKTFANYINGLRIDYVTRKLITESVYREYKIEYLAEECGFASRQVFLRCFKRETGFTPSYFIENLKKDDSENRV